MDIVDKINYLIKEKSISKKEFAIMLQSLEPKLNSTGHTPKEQTIYGYLNKKRELKVELVPYIAEVLSVPEQELFTFELEYANDFNLSQSREARELISLLPYLPRDYIKYILGKFREYRTLYEQNTKGN